MIGTRLMTEKLLIINEKPTAAAAFAKALGGQSGTFNGNEYAVTNLYGHVVNNGVPDETALAEYKERVGKFANLDGIPWSYTWFDFNKKEPNKKLGDTAIRVLRDINGYLKNGYIPVIASDIDESGEGDLIVREVLIYLNYHGKTYREYHIDETKKEIIKALSNMKVVDEKDPVFRMAFARSNMDYLTQQLTRVSTMTIQGKGYKLPSPVPMGRLKSVMLNILGNQLIAIKNYKPSSVFESRYKLGKLMLIGKDVPQFKTKEEWNADGLPFESTVKETKQVRGETIPPKAITLSKLAGLMSKKGMKAKPFLATYQKMYEAGYMSYPRTEDDFVSPEQFNEMLPIVDSILDILSLPKAVFTHRQPRPTHVKTGGSHGAIRPGLTLPKNIQELDDKFGSHASDIYQIASERFLMMFLENTEWIRHEYETTETPKPFKGSIKIITKQGVVDPDEKQDDVGTTLPDLSNKAQLYPHEVKSHKPHATDTDWLMTELGKVNVGTGATRVKTMSDMAGNKPTYPIKEGKTLDLSTMGWVGYHAAQGTKIGSVEGTQYITKLVKEVKNGKDMSEAYQEFTDVINHDVDVLKSQNFDLAGLNVPTAAPRVNAEGAWNGQNVKFNKVFMNHEFTDDEVNTLLNNGEVIITVKDKAGKDVKVKGKLAEQEYKGNKFIGYKGEFMREGYVTGNWNGRDVTIKGSYMDHKFTSDELTTLFAGGSVNVETHKDDKTYNLTGKLEVQEYNGRQFIGYKGVFPLREGYVKGVWKGRTVTFKGSFMDHVFTDDEKKKLLGGEKIHVTTHKGDKTYELDGKLAEQEYKGRKFIGFKGEFANTPREGYVKGEWNGNQVSFKGVFMKHTFTQAEIDKLLAGDKISFDGVTSSGNDMTVHGGLAKQIYQGRSFVGFKAEFNND